MRIALLSNINIDPLESHLNKDFSYVYKAEYDQYLQEITTNDSPLHTETFDIILLHLDGTELFKNYLFQFADYKKTKHELEKTAHLLFQAIEQFLSKNNRSLLILNTLFLCPYTVNNFLERNTEFSFVDIKDWFNQELSHFSQRFSNAIIMDWNRITSIYGYNNLYDERFWYLGRIKYNSSGFEILHKEIQGLIKAYRGLIKKVLVLDIDNTLWGGVIGEDGINGIQLSEEGIGKAFIDFQKTLKASRDLGIILALCSKNNFEDVKEAFEKHPMMVLKMNDFVSMKINWENKVINMKEIADSLNLGLDSFVFLDDNPVERELIRQSLPEVTVPDFPQDPAELTKWFMRDVLYVYFPKVYITEEDRLKTGQYRAKLERKKISEKFDIDDFISNLGIKLNVHINDKRLIERTAQMTQKTNQFNLTTRRYTKNDIERFMDSPDCFIFNLEYEDRFGKEGIIGTAIVKISQDIAHLDTLLMSCRVIGRKIEYNFLHELFDFLCHRNIRTITAEYLPTKKNPFVSDFYEKAGFDMEGSPSSEGIKYYKKDISSLMNYLAKSIV